MGKYDRWQYAKRYRWFNRRVFVIRARDDEPPKYYTELHVNGQYFSSHGSHMRLSFLAAIETLISTVRS